MDNNILKFTIITVVYNGERTIGDTIASVLSQSYPLIEYIIVDGGSSDGTLAIVKKYGDRISKVISEPDTGLYDAMNKGISLANGDIIGFLHSDDIYFNNDILSTIADTFQKNDIGSVFGDLVYVDTHDTDKIRRYYKGGAFSIERLANGCMPPHPTFFLKRIYYEQFGVFKTDYKIAADFELLARFLAKHKITFEYIPKIFVKMRKGGISTRNWKSNLILNKEILRACTENDIKTNYLKIYLKYFTKAFQVFDRPK